MAEAALPALTGPGPPHTPARQAGRARSPVRDGGGPSPVPQRVRRPSQPLPGGAASPPGPPPRWRGSGGRRGEVQRRGAPGPPGCPPGTPVRGWHRRATGLPRPGRGGAGRRCRRGGAGGHHGLALVVVVRRLLPPGAAARLPAAPPPAGARLLRPAAAGPQRGGECGAAGGRLEVTGNEWRGGKRGTTTSGAVTAVPRPGSRSAGLSQPTPPLPPGKREGPEAVPLCEWPAAGGRAGSALPWGGGGGLAGGRSAQGARLNAGLKVFRAGLVTVEGKNLSESSLGGSGERDSS